MGGPSEAATHMLETHLRHSLPSRLHSLLQSNLHGAASTATASMPSATNAAAAGGTRLDVAMDGEEIEAWVAAKQRLQQMLLTLKFSKPFRHLLQLQLLLRPHPPHHAASEEYGDKSERWQAERVSIASLRRLATLEQQQQQQQSHLSRLPGREKLYFELPEQERNEVMLFRAMASEGAGVQVDGFTFSVGEILRALFCGLLLADDLRAAFFVYLILQPSVGDATTAAAAASADSAPLQQLRRAVTELFIDVNYALHQQQQQQQQQQGLHGESNSSRHKPGNSRSWTTPPPDKDSAETLQETLQRFYARHPPQAPTSSSSTFSSASSSHGTTASPSAQRSQRSHNQSGPGAGDELQQVLQVLQAQWLDCIFRSFV